MYGDITYTERETTVFMIFSVYILNATIIQVQHWKNGTQKCTIKHWQTLSQM